MIDIPSVNFDLNSIPIDEYWNLGLYKESKLHKIHSYPAKFPAFLSIKALKYARDNNHVVNKIADIFCGCGTVALESRKSNIDFWGCDINPVATLIARVKSESFQINRLLKYHSKILIEFEKINQDHIEYEYAPERIKYWFNEKSFKELTALKTAINSCFRQNSKYLDFFMTAFSNILKPASKWLAKSIKPQIDPNKKNSDILLNFNKQVKFMIDSVEESSSKLFNSKSEIVNRNFLDNSLKLPKVDLIVTSPPYVTSYEYADLHQLSTLWLDFASDYRKFRFGSIGSSYHDENISNIVSRLNETGLNIFSRLYEKDKNKSKSVAKYFFDMQNVTKRMKELLNENGLVFIIIGNTEYKKVKIDNAKHLIESMYDSGFKNIKATKRKISGKILTPYRDKNGRFTKNSSNRKVYNEEFIIIGEV